MSKNSEDDEECLPENGILTTYLQNLGFNDMELKKSHSNFKALSLQSQKLKNPILEIIDEDTVRQIGILVSTQMLFEEDIKNIENLLSNFKIKRHEMLKSMFQGTFAIIVIVLGLILYWVIGNYIVFIGSSLYAYKAAEYLWKKDYSQRRLKKLSSILHSNYVLLSRTVKFISENDKIVENATLHNNKKINELKSGFDYYNSFKLDFCMSLKEMINVLANSTKKLISQVPLSLYIENPNCYICNNVNENYESNNLYKLYQIYLLVQSEFLQRFILSLVPNFNVSQKSNFQELNKILTESCVNLLKVKNNLNKKFKFIFLNGIYSSKTQSNLNAFVKPKIHFSKYEEELASNIHYVSNAFQNLLIKSRTLEETLKLNKVSSDMENDLMSLQTELNSCQRNISDGFILLKKVNKIKEKKNEEVEIGKKNIEEIEIENQKVLVDCTNSDLAIEDEIFEACLEDDNADSKFTSLDDWDFEDVVKKRLQKEYSQFVMTELKTKLVEKAENWKRREAAVMYKKGIDQSNRNTSFEKISSDLNNENQVINLSKIECLEKKKSSNENEVHNAKFVSELNNEEKLILREKSLREKPCNSILKKELIREELSAEKSSDIRDDFNKNSLNFMNQNFFIDLNAARQKILQKNATEEEQLFCDPDNSEEIISEK